MTDSLNLEIGHVLFIDIVGYSKLLINEQTELLEHLKAMVRGSTRACAAEAEGKLLRLATGDGMALVFRDHPEAPAQCAIELSRADKEHPELKLRMGIHSGPINEIADVNERANVTGGGINMAQRVMDCGDAGHILLSKRVADDLAQYRHWHPLLHDLGECEVKHGVRLGIVNLYDDEIGNPAIPARFTRPHADAPAPVTKRSPQTRSLTIGLAVIALVGATIWWASDHYRSTDVHPEPAASPAKPPSSPEKSIAVLPFVDLSQAKDQEYLCDGISEEILETLAKVKGLRVVARTSSFSFKGREVGVAEIAHKLGVGNILEGSLRRDGNRIRVAAQLVNADDGFQLWSETYEKEFAGVFAMQDEITRAITDALEIKLIGPAPGLANASNLQAYDLYLQAVYYSNKSSEADLRKSLTLFQQSLIKEPASARSWAGIAKVWNWLADAYVRPLEAYPASREAALKALALDDKNAEAHAYLAECRRILDWDVAGGEAELRRALQIDPNSGEAHVLLALNLALQRKTEESIGEIHAAVAADPLSPIVNNFAAVAALARGNPDEAINFAKRINEIDPTYLYRFPTLGYAYLQKGLIADAITVFRDAESKLGIPQAGLAIAYARSGKRAEAEKILERILQVATTSQFPGEEVASIYVALGDHDAAFQWLERAVQQHSATVQTIGIEQIFAPLRSDPRFGALLQRIGLGQTSARDPH